MSKSAHRYRRVAIMAALSSIPIVTSTPFGAPVSAANTQAAHLGRFDAPEEFPIVAIHASLGADGKVITYGSRLEADFAIPLQGGMDVVEYDPDTGEITINPNGTSTDIFCNTQAFDPVTGQTIMFGGDILKQNNFVPADGTDPVLGIPKRNADGSVAVSQNAVPHSKNVGNADILTYDSETNTLSSAPGMNSARWYGSSLVRPNGEIYVQGGAFGQALGNTPQEVQPPEEWFEVLEAESGIDMRGTDDGRFHPEIWSSQLGARTLNADTSSLYWYYPRIFSASNGRVFGTDTSGKLFWVSEDLTTTRIVGQIPKDDFDEIGVSAVQFAPDKILVFGNTTKSYVVDFSTDTPIVTRSGDLAVNRLWANTVVFPDGQVGVFGGSRFSQDLGGNDAIINNAHHFMEIWNPATGQWRRGADGLDDARLYHSTSILMPDGSVMNAGGGLPGPITNFSYEIYQPYYLLNADGSFRDRPVITDGFDRVSKAGERMIFHTDTVAERVTLVGYGSVTHATNSGQRFLDVEFSQTGSEIELTLPENEGVMPPGLYHVFVLDEFGTPSESMQLQVLVSHENSFGSVAGDELVRLYQAYFLRQPDWAGYQYWLGQLNNGLTISEISGVFARSTEFQNTYGSLNDSQFVTQLYRNVFNREPDAAGFEYWVSTLRSTSRGSVVANFAASAEFVVRTKTMPVSGLGNPTAGLRSTSYRQIDLPKQTTTPTTSLPFTPGQQLSCTVPGVLPAVSQDVSVDPVSARVHRLYTAYFLRQPDIAGFEFWRGVMSDTGYLNVSSEFARSVEFQNTYGSLSNAEFVRLVYNNVMCREPDVAGYEYWLGLLNSGNISRPEIMQRFAESSEYLTKTKTSFSLYG